MPRRSEPGLDLFRACLVLGMFAVHARRLQPSATRIDTLADRALDALMWAEPYIAAGFLLVVGTSLVLGRRARVSIESWRAKLVRRAIGLYLASMALFVAQYGIELPDLLVSSGILSVIAIAIVTVGFALDTRRPRIFLLVVAAASIAVTALLDRSGVGVSGINAGPGGALPLVAFSAFGAILELERARVGNRVLAWGSAGAAPLLLVALASGADWTTLRSSLYRAHSGLVALPHVLEETARAPVQFWNHSAVGAIGLSMPLSLGLLASFALPKAIARARSLSPLALLGRHALAAYVLHLGLLGLLELSGARPTNAALTWSLVGGLTLCSLLLGWVLDRRRIQPAPASDAAVGAQTPTS